MAKRHIYRIDTKVLCDLGSEVIRRSGWQSGRAEEIQQYQPLTPYHLPKKSEEATLSRLEGSFISSQMNVLQKK